MRWTVLAAVALFGCDGEPIDDLQAPAAPAEDPMEVVIAMEEAENAAIVGCFWMDPDAWGCCGNSTTPINRYGCAVCSTACYIHDAICSDCEPKDFCLSGCVPDRNGIAGGGSGTAGDVSAGASYLFEDLYASGLDPISADTVGDIIGAEAGDVSVSCTNALGCTFENAAGDTILLKADDLGSTEAMLANQAGFYDDGAFPLAGGMAGIYSGEYAIVVTWTGESMVGVASATVPLEQLAAVLAATDLSFAY